MNIVQIPRRFVREEWGGTEAVVLETSKQLLRAGHQTEILCPNALARNNHETIEGVPVHRTSYFYPYLGLRPDARALMDKKGGNLFSFELMRELQTRKDLDIIHLHTLMRLGGIGRYVAKARNIPYVVTLHGGYVDVPGDEFATLIEPARGTWEWGRLLGLWLGSRRVVQDAAAILCVGENERQAVAARYPDANVIYLPNGVDVPRFRNGDRSAFRAQHAIPEHARVLLTVARIDSQKNQLFTIQAMPALLQENPDTYLLLVGPVTNADYHAQLLAEAKKLGVDHRVQILPSLSGQSLVDAYHAADVFVLSSRHEPFGIVILEAWAAGLPVVAAKVGGIPHFARDNEDTLLFEPEDTNGFLSAIQALSKSPNTGNRLRQNAHQRVTSEFSWEIITRRLIQVYESVRRP